MEAGEPLWEETMAMLVTIPFLGRLTSPFWDYIACTRREPKHYGWTSADICQMGGTWERAIQKNEISHLRGIIIASLRVSVLHILQPAVYIAALQHHLLQLGHIQRALGLVVAARELMYLCLILACTLRVPAFFLIDTSASMRDKGKDPDAGLGFLLMYTLSPERLARPGGPLTRD